MLECVVNISEGRDGTWLDGAAARCGADLLDVHRDVWHDRSVFTLVGEEAPRRLASHAVRTRNIQHNHGVHPKIGMVDVVPFVPLAGATMADAERARDAFMAWASETLDLPCFAYGTDRTLPEIRRRAFDGLRPDTGPAVPHPTAGACAVGARPLLVAYNLYLVESDLALAQRVASAVRGDGIRALGLAVGERVQVSMNLVEPLRVGPAAAWDRVAAHAEVAAAELVGLVPRAVLDVIPVERRAALDLDAERTIEGRLARREGG